MTPSEAFAIARQFDDHAVTGNRDSDGFYNSMLLQFHEKQVVFLVAGDTGSVHVHVFYEDTARPGQNSFAFHGSEPLWLAAVLSGLAFTNPNLWRIKHDQSANARV